LEEIMRLRVITGVAIAGALLLAACGGSGSHSSSASTPIKSTKATAAVSLGMTPLGNVLVDSEGRTLYGFTNDTNGMTSCYGTCAQNWPPTTVSAGWTAGTGLNRAVFHTIKRADGQLQLVAGKWPLYRFAGDSQPGDVNGQGSLGKWFVVRADGSLMKGTASPSASPNTAPSTSPSSSSGSSPAASGSGYGY
jgi:predicted lipoprotein with Yx(FWY)xxD motif